MNKSHLQKKMLTCGLFIIYLKLYLVNFFFFCLIICNIVTVWCYSGILMLPSKRCRNIYILILICLKNCRILIFYINTLTLVWSIFSCEELFYKISKFSFQKSFSVILAFFLILSEKLPSHTIRNTLGIPVSVLFAGAIETEAPESHNTWVWGSIIKKGTLGNFAVGNFAVENFAVGNFAVRKFRRRKVLPYGYFAVRKFCRKEISP